MGACASVPKAMRGKADAPAPEEVKEETHAVIKEVKVEDGSVKKVEETEEKKVEGQSLGTLLVETEAPKETVKEEATKVESKESTAVEALPVSEPAAPVTSTPVETATVATPAPAAEAASLKEEEKKTEVAEKK